MSFKVPKVLTCPQPTLDLKNVISVLISSEFLRIKDLVDECISYIVLNISDIVKLPIDMECLNDHLLWKIAAKMPVELLLNFVDKRDKLQTRIIMTKLYQAVRLKAA